jgi:hypothetical protein
MAPNVSPEGADIIGMVRHALLHLPPPLYSADAREQAAWITSLLLTTAEMMEFDLIENAAQFTRQVLVSLADTP